MQQDEAETIALEVLTFIAADDYLMRGLLAQSGLTLDDFRNSVSDPGFLGQVLDYFMTNEKAVTAFLEETAHPGHTIKSARQALPAASDQYWS